MSRWCIWCKRITKWFLMKQTVDVIYCGTCNHAMKVEEKEATWYLEDI